MGDMLNAAAQFRMKNPILTSIIDNDLYKLTMGSVVFHDFHNVNVTYKFFNRGNTEFPEGFAQVLRNQIWMMQDLKLTDDEFNYLQTIPYLRRTYLEWFRGFRYDCSEISINKHGGSLNVKIKGPWYRTIFWEVPLMAIISQLYFEIRYSNAAELKNDDWIKSIKNKSAKLSNNNCHWIDFGTRRRFNYKVQEKLNEIMSGAKGYLGTSNLHFSHKFNIKPHGTYAHEVIMAMQAKYGAKMANKIWMTYWQKHFDGLLGTALTDTFTTDVFLQDFGPSESRLFDGVRHDSSCPILWGNKMLNHYARFDILPTNKRFIFSDGLTTDSFIYINKMFSGKCQPIGGIGTHFTNDIYTEMGKIKPLNIVIKLSSADFGSGPVNVVKLSDESGKHTGTPESINFVKQELNFI